MNTTNRILHWSGLVLRHEHSCCGQGLVVKYFGIGPLLNWGLLQAHSVALDGGTFFCMKSLVGWEMPWGELMCLVAACYVM